MKWFSVNTRWADDSHQESQELLTLEKLQEKHPKIANLYREEDDFFHLRLVVDLYEINVELSNW